MNKIDLLPLLSYINPAALDYQEWVNIGMALKNEGYSPHDWDNWSSLDSARYHSGECFKKWETFRGDASKPVTGATIVAMAKDNGWQGSKREDKELDWDDIIGNRDEMVFIDKNWLEGKEIAEPEQWNPIKDLVTYLETLFEASENVGYVTTSWEKDGKYFPTKGNSDRTAGELIEQLNRCGGDIGSVLGDYSDACGAWIRFNPLDGKGVKNENVTDFRYALVESDKMEIEKQYEIIQALDLPVACLVHSGKKSLHAIVRIDASSYDEYRKRVDYLYSICKKNGLEIDTQNRNPSRLSRMPGVMRDGQKQFLVATKIGKASFVEWQEWIEAVNDDLPEPESISAVWDNLPKLAEPLIDGVLRQGHKMLIAGPSKAGKSFALVELCCAIAEGKQWFDFNCTQGKVLYVNLELDRASCLHRFKDVYIALGWRPDNLANIDVWNLRGKSIPMDKLAPKLIRRAVKKNYIAIIIDPIYKIITGDENSADQMAHFCNQFDKVCTELGCAVIYCHHHSKGGQGAKRSMDRASGSGVFARDPDALMDLIELDTNEDLIKQEENKAACSVCIEYLKKKNIDASDLSQDDALSEKATVDFCSQKLSASDFKELTDKVISQAKRRVKQRTAWRIEGTLREFPKFPPINLWFDYPVHLVDNTGGLKDIDPEGAVQAWKGNFKKKKSPDEAKKERQASLQSAFEAASFGGVPTTKSMAEYLGRDTKTVLRYIKEGNIFVVNAKGEVAKK